jgi:hypothetical protein
MYCRGCGSELASSKKACNECGVHPLNSSNYCQNCTSPTKPNQVRCTHCPALLVGQGAPLGTRIVSLLVPLFGTFLYFMWYYKRRQAETTAAVSTL